MNNNNNNNSNKKRMMRFGEYSSNDTNWKITSNFVSIHFVH